MKFERASTSPNFTRPSLLTKLLHHDNAQSNTTETPNGLSTSNSPQEDSGLEMRLEGYKPMDIPPQASSPRTARRGMLQTELTESLKMGLLVERKATWSVRARLQTPETKLQAMTENAIEGANLYNLPGYHQKGW
ncbi:uncharacterized protein BDZ99DRAFT_93729 [Mytilinidion resinicola]|uniref:DUF3295 domain-containing protein n=1 Tax=Mytilinidion resinicola TaxID=574789 RepID=A0A6A6YEB0_9PEZI|nr:uncharacterized protein BDZ99DRAFT_93729 [Mytilinidion resinicola]KAF2806334.1 hypothetical protein BDZ99DRAFT_93729 [Mytilinidion resinicola]